MLAHPSQPNYRTCALSIFKMETWLVQVVKQFVQDQAAENTQGQDQKLSYTALKPSVFHHLLVYGMRIALSHTVTGLIMEA